MKAMSFDELRSSADALTATATAEVFKNLTAANTRADHFYLTGYEGLCFGMDHETLTRSVISSAVPMYGELLAIGNEQEIEAWSAICRDLHIAMTSIVSHGADAAQAVADILAENPAISHILCTTDYAAIKSLSQVAHKHRVAVIADTDSVELDMAFIEDAGIDFAISTTPADEMSMSIIIARRSRLVMTEGNARPGEHDIYAAWQDSLASRNSTIIPMA